MPYIFCEIHATEFHGNALAAKGSAACARELRGTLRLLATAFARRRSIRPSSEIIDQTERKESDGFDK